ncbi:facilitated trehalose transporter Tret1-2 homolog [Bombyx mandarina]|uniref:Facilitated trehalose transporter Tret1-2 homolog n=1 Tax=Bombyx mandarina TaxID=7092 RepID=A0A6J2JFB6_BOMMA|nr:facilitated trehalose transporter Tret1-2 homolog [Bombyx mandarina]
MDTYDSIENTVGGEKEKSNWTSFRRQLFITSGVCSIYFVLGLCYGIPNVVIPQLRKEANSTEAVSEEMASWITSVHGYSALPWILVLPVMTRLLGRKIPFILVCMNTLIGYTMFYCSNNATFVLISEIMQGSLAASNMTVLILIVTEYTTPKYRGIFMTVKSTIFFWGVWIANATGTFFHWKKIAIYALVFSIYPFTVFFWPESPSWLAMKGKFTECAAAHHWLKGYGNDSEKELDNLIKAQKEYLKQRMGRNRTLRSRVKGFFEKMTTKGFYAPLLLSMCVMSLYNFSGKFVCTMYSIELIKKITNSESTAYLGMLILEAVTILSMHFGSVLSRFLRRRTLLLGSSFLGIIFLLILSMYLYLISLKIIDENKVVSISLLTIFSMTISCGPMILACSVYGELTPIRFRSSSLPLLALYSEFLMASVLKISPYIFKALKLHGAFLFYGLSASVFAFILYKFLPETKDKTLQEIEKYFQETSTTKDLSKQLIVK